MNMKKILKAISDDECVLCFHECGMFVLDNTDNVYDREDGTEVIVVQGISNSAKVPTKEVLSCEIINKQLYILRELLGDD